MSSITKPITGFWLYLMSDCLLFASLFATYLVLQPNTADGPSARMLFSLPYVLIETLILLTSSYSCGLTLQAAQRGSRRLTLVGLSLTALLGATFIGMELHELTHLVNDGNGWRRSGFLSAFFTLVSTHGLHIIIGLLWISCLVFYIQRRGLTTMILAKLRLFSLFWHFLDLIWIFIFSFVYLLGVR